MKREKNIFSPFLGWIRQWRGRIDFRERKSNFSLIFPAIGPSVLDEPRGKVALRCKGYAWAPILWSFNNSGGGGGG